MITTNESKLLNQSTRSVWGWCMYDFANSPYTTLMVSFIYSVYFTKAAGEDGTILWSRAITVTAITVALLSPFLGAIADQSASRKRFLAVSTFLLVACVAGLNFTPATEYTMLALILFVLSNIAYEMGVVFYNSFLPDITSAKNIGRVSGYGWGLGYAGGLAALCLSLFLFPQFGITFQSPYFINAVLCLVAGWMAVFCIPTFLWVKETKVATQQSTSEIIQNSFHQLYNTFHEIRKYKQIVRLLLARLFYNDGIITIFVFAGIYAGNEFGFTTQTMLLFGIAVNIAAGLGAVCFGYLDDYFGGKNTILISLVGLFTATLLAAIAWNPLMIWVAGILAGLFSGPNQAASRSLLGRFVPKEKETEFYGFFAFSGKMTAFMGPFCYGVMTQLFETERAGVAFILLFFIVGGGIMLLVNDKEFVTIQNHEV